tara:strand:- start:12310 stop:13311 length:1002 start_codon:yes stop_codon:yes gene_type:complete
MAKKIVYNGHSYRACVDKDNTGVCDVCERESKDVTNKVCQSNFVGRKGVKRCGEKRCSKAKWVPTRSLIRDTYYLIEKLPSDIDAVIGVPRSGMLPASVVATTLHLPLYTLRDSELVSVGSGKRFNLADAGIRHAVVIDDTVNRGREMDRVNSLQCLPNYTTACVYVTPSAKTKVDIFSKPLPNPHYLEWNFFNSGFVTSTAFDIDGILCPDVKSSNDDDGAKYMQHLTDAPVRYAIRNNTANVLVTARLGKYRDATEEWLGINGINYDKLVMGPWNNNRDRKADKEVLNYKVDAYQSSECKLFVESNDCLASNMARITSKPVLCPMTEKVYQ